MQDLIVQMCLIVQVILHCTGQTSLCKGDIIVQVDLTALTPTLGRLWVVGSPCGKQALF